MKVRRFFFGFWRNRKHFLFDLSLVAVMVFVAVALHALRGGSLSHLVEVLHAVSHFVTEVFSAEVVAGIAFRIAAVAE